jgi:predicted transcriptional regulator
VKRLSHVGPRGAELLQDRVNMEIVKTLIRSEMSASALARKLNLPLTNVWRRLMRLQREGIVEVVRKEKTGNLEVKYYRATAVFFMVPSLIAPEPRDEKVKRALELYGEIRKRAMDIISKNNVIPQGVDPVDYSIALDLFINLMLLTSTDFQEKGKEILSLISHYAFKR